MAFSGRLVEPTKLDKITLRQAAILFNKDRTPKSKQKEKGLSLSLTFKKTNFILLKWMIIILIIF